MTYLLEAFGHTVRAADNGLARPRTGCRASGPT